jgi:tetrathionate reductase subunit B
MNSNSGPKINRRELLKGVGKGSALVTIVAAAPGVAQAATEKKVRYGMVIDVRRCSGCQACSIACKSEFDVPIGAARSWVEHHEAGVFPNTEKRMLPRLCNHCSEPPCVDVCPVEGGTYKRDDGIVVVDENICIGCAKCVEACPYDARFMNSFKGDPGLTKGNGAADKCDFCLHRISRGVAPACVNTCPGKARIFGDLNDPSSEVAKLVAEIDATVLRRDKKTKPSVFYIGADWIESKNDKKAKQFSRVDTNRNERSSKRFA